VAKATPFYLPVTIYYKGDIMRNSGIYKITNIINNNFYIGSSSNIRKRKERHFRYLKNNRHENKHLQNAFNKYGKDAFVFEIIKYLDQDQLLYEEQLLLNEYFGQSNLYNICPTAGSPSVKGRIKTEEHRQKIANSVKMFYEDNPKHRELLSSYRVGKPLSDEIKQKMRQSKKRGDIHHNAKLNDEIVNSIRQKYQPKTYSYNKLAKEYGVDKKTIIRIIQRKTWTHI
jgi:group I intron endonuclease